MSCCATGEDPKETLPVQVSMGILAHILVCCITGQWLKQQPGTRYVRCICIAASQICDGLGDGRESHGLKIFPGWNSIIVPQGEVDGVRQCQMRSSKKPLVGPYRGSIALYGIPYEACLGFHGIGFVFVWCSVAQRWWLNKQCSSQQKSPCPFQKKPALSSVFTKKSA